MSDPQQPDPAYGTPSGPEPPGYGAAPQPGPPPQPGYAGYGQPGAQPGYPPGAPGYGAPYYPPPVGMMVPGQQVTTPYGVFVVGHKSKMAAGLLGIFLGFFGGGAFYRGHTGIGVAQLVVSIVTFGLGALWGLIEGIMVLAASPGTPSSLDSDGYLMV